LFVEKEYKLSKVSLSDFQLFLKSSIHPFYFRHNVKLIDSWYIQSEKIIKEYWEYKDIPHFNLVCRQYNENLRSIIDSKIAYENFSFVYRMGGGIPKNIVSVFGCIFNDKDEVLIMKSLLRQDTWEFPGGLVDENEPLDLAVKREIYEETGFNVDLEGITGIYSNIGVGNIVIGFKGRISGGKLKLSEETKELKFIKLEEKNISSYFKRDNFAIRALDAIKNKAQPIHKTT
jgi:8-oxo-dGTP diphosphatase